MSMQEQISKVEAELSAVGCSVKSLCDAAGINQSTWTHWKAGSNSPNMATWSRVSDALISIRNTLENEEGATQ